MKKIQIQIVRVSGGTWICINYPVVPMTDEENIDTDTDR
jgi:hypothetical protein